MSTVGAGAFEELRRRISRAVSTGNPLQGMKFYEQFDMRNEGARDLPRVYITDYQDSEEHGGGTPTGDAAVTPDSGASAGINSVLRNSITVTMQIVVDRKNGWFTDPSTVTQLKKMGVVNVKNLLLDEIEKADDGKIDCSFGGELDSPPMFDARESGIFDLGIVMDVTVRLQGRRFNRATRACLVASP